MDTAEIERWDIPPRCGLNDHNNVMRFWAFGPGYYIARLWRFYSGSVK